MVDLVIGLTDAGLILTDESVKVYSPPIAPLGYLNVSDRGSKLSITLTGE